MSKLPPRILIYDGTFHTKTTPRKTDVDGVSWWECATGPVNPRIDKDEDGNVTGWHEATPEDIAAEEAERIAGLAAEHGTMVGQLVAALGAFGITLPTSLPECMPVMYAACKADPTLNADSQLAQVLYSQLLNYMTDDDIYHVSLILNQ